MNKESGTCNSIALQFVLLNFILFVFLILPLPASAQQSDLHFVSICNRTEAVRVAIQKEVAAQRFTSGVGGAVLCQTIQISELSRIEYLQVIEKEISALKPGDFEDLSGLKILNLESNNLMTLDVSAFSGLIHLETLVLARNPLRKLGNELCSLPNLRHLDVSGGKLSAVSSGAFACNPKLEAVFLNDNSLKELPPDLFLKNEALKIVDLSGNRLESFPSALTPRKGELLSLNLSRNKIPGSGAPAPTSSGHPSATPAIPPERQSPAAQGVARLRFFVRSHWRLPLDVTTAYSSPGPFDLNNPALRVREERLLLRQIEEVQEAYRRSAFDFFDVQIRFSPPGAIQKTPLVRYNKKKLGIEILLKAPDEATGRASLITDEQILETLADHFNRNRSVAWFTKETREDLQAALKRDFIKTARMDNELRFDILRLDDLIDTAMTRTKLADEKNFFSETELADARFIQFRVLLTFQRLENTMARWRLAEADPEFPYHAEVRLLLAECSGMYRTYLDWFLNVVVGGRPTINVFNETWYHRNPISKILDSEVPAGFFNLDGRVSTRIPPGAVRDLLKSRLSVSLLHYLHGMRSLDQKVSASDILNSPLNAEMKQAAERIGHNRRSLAQHEISDTRAFKELWDARVKNSVKFPLYRATMSIATVVGDTRFSISAPAITHKQMADMKAHLKPGDLLIERTDHYLSNAFLGGFWPHGILYLGPKEEWSRLKLADGTTLAEDPWISKNILPNYYSAKDNRPALVMEAISDGVVFNSLEEAAQKDYIGIFRPKFAPAEQEAKIAAAIKRALKYHGRPYDFDFDFFTDDKLVCTELLYRAYHPDINFLIQKQAVVKPDPPVPGMIKKAGRDTMPANEIAKLALYMLDHKQPNASIGYTGQTLEFVRLYMKQGNGRSARIYEGAQGIEVLKRTLR